MESPIRISTSAFESPPSSLDHLPDNLDSITLHADVTSIKVFIQTNNQPPVNLPETLDIQRENPELAGTVDNATPHSQPLRQSRGRRQNRYRVSKSIDSSYSD